jgi:hypothetical protein
MVPVGANDAIRKLHRYTLVALSGKLTNLEKQ